MLITVEVHGPNVELGCVPCEKERDRVRVNSARIDDDQGVAFAVRSMIDHAHLEHGGPVDFSRPGGGQDTRRPVLSLPPGPRESNSSDPVTDGDPGSRQSPDVMARARLANGGRGSTDGTPGRFAAAARPDGHE